MPNTALVDGLRLFAREPTPIIDIQLAKWDPNAAASAGISSNNGLFTFVIGL